MFGSKYWIIFLLTLAASQSATVLAVTEARAIVDLVIVFAFLLASFSAFSAFSFSFFDAMFNWRERSDRCVCPQPFDHEGHLRRDNATS